MKKSFTIGIIFGSASVLGGIYLLKKNDDKIKKLKNLKTDIKTLATEFKEEVLPVMAELQETAMKYQAPISEDVQAMKGQVDKIKSDLPQ